MIPASLLNCTAASCCSVGMGWFLTEMPAPGLPVRALSSALLAWLMAAGRPCVAVVLNKMVYDALPSWLNACSTQSQHQTQLGFRGLARQPFDMQVQRRGQWEACLWGLRSESSLPCLSQPPRAHLVAAGGVVPEQAIVAGR